MRPSRGEQLLPLTGLRFFLAALVLLHHITHKGWYLNEALMLMPTAVVSIVRNGYLAVNTFFVLSGFVLTHSYCVRNWTRKSLTSYGVARLARVLPVYFLSLLIVSPFIVSNATPPSSEWGTSLASYVFLVQGWTGKLKYNWNTPAWSLSCEIFFYLCFPLVVLWLGRMGRKATILVAAITVVAPEALLRAGVPEVWKPLIHLSDFLVGIATARAYTLLTASNPKWKGRGPWLYIPAALGGLTLFAMSESLVGIMRTTDALRPFNALLLLGLAFGGGWPARWISGRIAVYLGQASYALYILHIPLLWWHTRLVRSYLGLPPKIISGLLFTSIAIATSVLVFRYVEAPLNSRIRNWARGWSS